VDPDPQGSEIFAESGTGSGKIFEFYQKSSKILAI
jgi:hypothetical protein